MRILTFFTGHESEPKNKKKEIFRKTNKSAAMAADGENERWDWLQVMIDAVTREFDEMTVEEFQLSIRESEIEVEAEKASRR